MTLKLLTKINFKVTCSPIRRFRFQILTNVQVLRQMNVILTPCVPTPKDPTSVAVLEGTKEMEGSVQVNTLISLKLVSSKAFAY